MHAVNKPSSRRKDSAAGAQESSGSISWQTIMSYQRAGGFLEAAACCEAAKNADAPKAWLRRSPLTVDHGP
jgi:hypothetical protein